jgi:cyclic beta-1,2-glucan synthetase
MSTSLVEPATPPERSAQSGRRTASDIRSSEPVRGDLFGPEHLEAFARELAGAAAVAAPGGRVPSAGEALRTRFATNGRELARARVAIVAASARQEALAPDAEWLLDNYHIIDDTLREVRQDLPRGYYKELPKLVGGTFRGLPRVYELAVELIAHTDSSLDETNLTRFVEAYQQVTPLTIGELWAVPIMLRVVLVDNLRRLAGQMLYTRTERQQAEKLAASIADHVRRASARPAKLTWSDPCVVRLVQVLRDQGPEAAEHVEWVENCLTCHGPGRADLVRREHGRQAANQVTVGNCVTSLRLLSNLDWPVFLEKTSVVESLLRGDPARVYARQDFGTKDRYRRAVEQLARRSGRDEPGVVRRLLELANAVEAPADDPSAAAALHVGYYLVGAGRRELEREIGYRPTLGERLRRVAIDYPEAVYFGGLAVGTALVLAAVVAASGGTGWLVALLLAAAFLPATEVAVAILHYLITLLLPPRVLAKLDFKDGISADCATFVVMPTMLIGDHGIADLADRLEVHYLSNPDPQLRFALLTDFADAPAEHMPEDERLIAAALQRIQALNRRYAADRPDRFFLFHRSRRWNPAENCWMGYERKRGKLGEFNRLLRGATDTTYTTLSSDPGELPPISYVITLDADTQLPRESAARLVATLAHPLNRPRFDPAQGRVVEGYGVLQPRVSLSLLAGTRSLFARLLASSAGIDPYTTAVSDVYQDLFGRGTYTGKGIYDVDAFEASAGHALPDNRILSHDLIEGNYARCGLVTDIELLDDFPARYNAYARREHRWVRGDWQIGRWGFPHVPAPVRSTERGSDLRPNPLAVLERWKVLDNLRRSLMPPAVYVLLALGWTVLPGSPWLWSGMALLTLAMPLVILVINSLLNLLRGGSWMLQLREIRGGFAATAGQILLSAAFLASQAYHMIDAIVRTLWRLGVSQRRLLEWETASAAEQRLGSGLKQFAVSMASGPASALVLGGLTAATRPGALPAALPWLAAWLVSPLVAWYVSQPRVAPEPPLDDQGRRELRRIARKVWHFFDTFVTADDHWLPPDNYQEIPKGQIAHRTSPTNMGLYLLSSLAAHDLGYETLGSLADRVEQTFGTFDNMDRHNGHFQNWYDTRTLKVLPPAYVSTVDSGNLLGCLLTLKQGLLAKATVSIDAAAIRSGLADALRLTEEALKDIEQPRAEVPEPMRALNGLIQDLTGLLRQAPADQQAARAWLESVAEKSREFDGLLRPATAALGETPEDVTDWATRFATESRAWLDEVSALAPWLETLEPEHPLHATSASDAEAVNTGWLKVCRLLLGVDGPADLAEVCKNALAALRQLRALGLAAESEARVDALVDALNKSTAPALRSRLHALASRAEAFAAAMDFRFLYNDQRHLFSIGFNRSIGRLDQSHYDLLASEAALTSFLAIARGDVPKKHWFQLGRQLTQAPGGGVALLSWGGTMFEYLMPRLLLRNYGGTLLDESSQGAVARQIEYGKQMRVPWGVSESGFAALDAALDYQYQSFGVPGLGLKRGLSRDLVIAPYATALALLVRPHAARDNFRALAADRGEGAFGFYEAIDYTRDRLREKRRSAVVRSYMSHHQGMTLLALADCLLDRRMVQRFHAEPMVRATELLLQERVPRVAPVVDLHEDETGPTPVVREGVLPMSRRITTPATPHPRTHLLSNGQYSVMLTNAGSGYSTWRDLDVTRWREDRTADARGQWLYVRELRSGRLWSAGHQPVATQAELYEVVFSTDKAEFRRRDAGIETHLEVTVSPEHPAEVRRLTLTNHNLRVQEFDLTSYVEVVLGPHRADVAHPAFGKLFLETEWVPSEDALLCRRRPRSAEEKPVWAVHVIAVDGPTVGATQYETDRSSFVGRGHGAERPAALDGPLSGTTGSVLDPVLSLRKRVRVAPGATVSVSFTTAVAASREEALSLADQYHDSHGVTRAFELAWAHSQVQLRHLKLSAEEAHLFQRLAAFVLYAGPTLRAPAAVIATNRQGQQDLWRLGISGDKPIVLLRIGEGDELGLVRQVLLAHAYWRLQGLEVDLVILNEHPTTYQDETTQQLQALVRTSDSHSLVDRPGGVFVRRADQLSADDRVLLQAAARVVLVGSRGSLSAQVDRREPPAVLPPALVATAALPAARPAPTNGRPPEGLLFSNGLGGFSPDGREYVVVLPAPARPGEQRGLPPAPWINVVANDRCGFLVSEAGAGYSWAGNSQTNRLTPWSNDPVNDPPGEVVYLRDETNGQVWTPTPAPLGAGPTVVRHGHGYTTFESSGNDLATELTLFVAPDDPVKIYLLRVRNTDSRPRRLSAAFCADWVLGPTRDPAPMHVVTELDGPGGAVLARNAFNADFGSAVAFADVNVRPRTATGDRTEFLGRNGSVRAPAALKRVGLADHFGAALDPCAAFLAPFELRPGETRDVVFVLGQAATAEEARRLAAQYREPKAARAALDEARRRWESILSAVQVKTPDPAFDLMMNRWLLYQVLSCRVRGRSAFYQSGGAYGFRDQLQDVMALAYAAPDETKAQILRAAARQFAEGDAQHWWHPPAGRGVRTRISDDFLFLPLVVHHYLQATGDTKLLDQEVAFLKAPPLRPDQEEDYGLPQTGDTLASIYEHCARAVDNGLRYGPHGLPLMGTGDWNDGMNRVGPRRRVGADGIVSYEWDGKGESIWDTWFQLTILPNWAELADRRGDRERAARWRQEAARLREAVEANAWDGAWYRRGYFDDGTPLGSAQNDECQIDSLAQSWAVTSGAADPARARQAMQAVYDRLVKRDDGLILLFAPPFDKGSLHPGYIKGYVPGIRENGGQYTHGAVWVVQAAADLGDGTRAAELFGLLNPIHHGSSPAAVAKYKVEPYVMAGDVYGAPPNTGRGGWTWYTGSAGWLYRVGLEDMLGFCRCGDKLRIDPCVPKEWKSCELTYRLGKSEYHITIVNSAGVESGVRTVFVDDRPAEGGEIALTDDGKRHQVRVEMG